MEYTITSEKRTFLLISSAVLILHYISLGLSFLYKDYSNMNSIENAVKGFFIILAYGYIYLFLINYFKKNSLNGLKIISIIILIAETATHILFVIHSFKPIIPKFFDSLFELIAVISMVILVILVLRLKRGNYSALNSLRKYAFGLITAYILGIVISIVITKAGLFAYIELMFLPLIIPYFFIIDFALKLRIENKNQQLANLKK